MQIKIENLIDQYQDKSIVGKDDKSVISSRMLATLVVWILICFLISYIFAIFLTNDKNVSPESLSTTWGETW